MRGFEVWHYDVATLAYESDGTPHGRITAHAAPVTVQRVEGDHFHAGDRRRIDNLVFANIGEMAKVAELSATSRPDDGRFEVVLLEHRPKWKQLWVAARAAFSGLGRQPATSDFRFTACGPMPVQIDGEVDEVAGGTAIRVRCAAGALNVVR